MQGVTYGYRERRRELIIGCLSGALGNSGMLRLPHALVLENISDMATSTQGRVRRQAYRVQEVNVTASLNSGVMLQADAFPHAF